MLTSEQILNRIDEIVDNAYISFTYRLAGADFLTEEQKVKAESLGLIIGDKPLIEILYLAARQRSNPGYKKDQTLNDLLDEIGRTGVLPALTDEEKYTVTHAKATVTKAVEEAKNSVKSEIKELVLDSNLNHKEQIALTPDITVPQRQEVRQENANNLVRNLTIAAVGAAAIKTFRREFTTNMTEIVNSAVADEVRYEARLMGERDPWVFKQIVDDNRTSPECRKLHTIDGSGANPRLYRLSELQRNGTNAGKPRSQWKATIGGTHPNCRCTLKKATPKMIEDQNKKS